jgi:two-component system CheB/CheR fusion protein
MTERLEISNNSKNGLLEKIKVSSGNSDYGLSLLKVITDETKQPTDLEFLFANTIFEELIGVQKNILNGKKVTEIFTEIKQTKFNWIEVLGQIGLNYGRAKFYYFSEKLQKWFLISAYCPDFGYLMVNLKNIPDLKAVETQIHSTDSIKWLIEEFK